jgi:hypothetical protein
MAKDPAWKRIVGGLVGIGIVIAILLLLRERGVSGADAQRWEEAIVIGAAAAGVAVWIVRRRSRR